MPRKFLYIPKTAKGFIKGGALSDTLEHIILPLNDAYPVTAENAAAVPRWAHQAGIPIPIDSAAARRLASFGVAPNIVPLPQVPQQIRQEQPRQSMFGRVNFDALASIISKVVLDYLDDRARRNEPWYMKALRYPTQIAETVASSRAEGTPINKENFLSKAAPVIGTIANSFLPGTGTAVKWGMQGLNWLKNRFSGSGRRRGGKLKKKRKGRSIFVFNNGTRQYLGQKVNFEKDIKKVADDAFKKKAEDNRWRKIISSAFSSAIKAVAPAIGSGSLILGRKIKKIQLKKMTKKKRGGSVKDYMAWVRSFKKKKRGKGVGKRKHRKHRRKHRGGKLKIYQSRGIYYPKPVKRRKHKKRGRGLVSSGHLMKGTPYDYSGMPPFF